MEDLLTSILNYIEESVVITSLVTVIAVPLLYLAKKSFNSRVKSDNDKAYFKYVDRLRILPLNRKGYSDRIAYIMAELSNLAYYEFENEHAADQSTLEKKIDQLSDTITKQEVSSLMFSMLAEATSNRGSTKVLEAILAQNHFELIKTINNGPVQGFITKSTLTDNDQHPFIVVAFRGSEKKVNDWLTNAQAKPKTLQNGELVHSGFYTSFQRVEDEIRECLKEYSDLPKYFTGHSLGGAWALLSARIINPPNTVGCYTYGAPKVANYEFFFPLKTPVYRIVNSADIVPRVPPGIIFVKTTFWVLTGLSKLTAFLPFLSKTFDKGAGFINKLKDYRHFGDQRYLTDVVDGHFENTQLLWNPNLADQSLWLWKGMLAGITYPVKSHSMMLYVKKLADIANRKQIKRPITTK